MQVVHPVAGAQPDTPLRDGLSAVGAAHGVCLGIPIHAALVQRGRLICPRQLYSPEVIHHWAAALITAQRMLLDEPVDAVSVRVQRHGLREPGQLQRRLGVGDGVPPAPLHPGPHEGLAALVAARAVVDERRLLRVGRASAALALDARLVVLLAFFVQVDGLACLWIVNHDEVIADGLGADRASEGMRLNVVLLAASSVMQGHSLLQTRQPQTDLPVPDEAPRRGPRRGPVVAPAVAAPRHLLVERLQAPVAHFSPLALRCCRLLESLWCLWRL
mmetsp:Transcript_12527/g.35711  ORF Transcript_12527/g.35711 Transcript_12527/m.35711 type:complete len:274 (+) Transcript_12527:206-1027(+)